MINSRKELRDWKRSDEKYFKSFSRKVQLIDKLTNSNLYIITKYIKKLRSEAYYFNKRSNLVCSLLYIWTRRKRMKLGTLLGFTMEPQSIGKGLIIEHFGCIVINGEAKLGENCRLRGNNCIGMGSDGHSPHIGNNVDIGFGATIIGGITIADDVKIAAGAVVVKSCMNVGATLIGIPAKEVS